MLDDETRKAVIAQQAGLDQLWETATDNLLSFTSLGMALSACRDRGQDQVLLNRHTRDVAELALLIVVGECTQRIIRREEEEDG